MTTHFCEQSPNNDKELLCYATCFDMSYTNLYIVAYTKNKLSFF